MTLNKQCLNCETTLLGDFCHECGQKNQPLHQPVPALFADAFSVITSWDNRAYVSLRNLLLRPGQATLSYNAGRRTEQVAPLRMFLFVGIVFFLLNSLIQSAVPATQAQMTEVTEPTLLHQSEGFWPALQERMEVKVRALVDHPVAAYEFQNKLYKSFYHTVLGLIPVFAFWLWLGYRSNQSFYSAHLVFALHFHTTAFLMFTLQTVVELLPLNVILASVLEVGVFFYLFWFLFQSLRRVYEESFLKTFLKWLMLLGLYLGLLFVIVVYLAARHLGAL